MRLRKNRKLKISKIAGNALGHISERKSCEIDEISEITGLPHRRAFKLVDYLQRMGLVKNKTELTEFGKEFVKL